MPVTLVVAPGAPTGVSATAERQRQRTRVDGSRQPIHRRLPGATPDGRRLGHLGQRRGLRLGHLHPPERCRRRDAPLRRAGPQLGRRRPVVRHRVHRPHHAAPGAQQRSRHAGRRRHITDLDTTELRPRRRLHRPPPRGRRTTIRRKRPDSTQPPPRTPSRTSPETPSTG